MVSFGGTIRINPVGFCILCGVVILLIYFNWSKTSTRHPEISLKQLLSVSIDCAERGGREVVRIREDPNSLGQSSKGKTKEGANDPLTNGDMLSHKAMYWGIKKAFPYINVISEEHDVESVDLNEIELPNYINKEVDSIVSEDTYLEPGDIAVWIDPLDATQEYTEDLREYVTTMVCVAVNGKPVLGVIYKPFEKITAWGWAGPDYISDTVRNDVKGSKAAKDLTNARIIVSRSHAGSVNSTAQEALGPHIAVTPAGGAGYKTWEVVKGTQDAYVHTTLIKKWDICAGNAILAALGGRLSTLKGEEIDYSGVAGQEKNTGGVLAALHHHQQLVQKLSSLAPARS